MKNSGPFTLNLFTLPGVFLIIRAFEALWRGVWERIRSAAATGGNGRCGRNARWGENFVLKGNLPR